MVLSPFGSHERRYVWELLERPQKLLLHSFHINIDGVSRLSIIYIVTENDKVTKVF